MVPVPASTNVKECMTLKQNSSTYTAAVQQGELLRWRLRSLYYYRCTLVATHLSTRAAMRIYETPASSACSSRTYARHPHSRHGIIRAMAVPSAWCISEAVVLQYCVAYYEVLLLLVVLSCFRLGTAVTTHSSLIDKVCPCPRYRAHHASLSLSRLPYLGHKSISGNDGGAVTRVWPAILCFWHSSGLTPFFFIYFQNH